MNREELKQKVSVIISDMTTTETEKRDRILILFGVSCSAFVEEVAPMAEYIKGKHYKDRYKKLMIPVIEHNELREAVKEYCYKHCL